MLTPVLTGFSTSSSSSQSSSSTDSPSNSKAAHENEGILKSIWHRVTHQHDNLTDDVKPEGKKVDQEKPKKASGSES